MLIETLRAQVKQAIRRGDMEQAGFYVRIIIGARSDIPLKLKPVSEILKVVKSKRVNPKHNGNRNGQKAKAAIIHGYL